jgi:hypothetical protein
LVVLTAALELAVEGHHGFDLACVALRNRGFEVDRVEQSRLGRRQP